jgi:TQXA domain-containing protein
MATLLELGLPTHHLSTGNVALAAPAADDGVTILSPRPLRRTTAAPITALSRVRGGTFSSTVGRIRFTDGSTAHTDLIRLNPNIDTYSLDFSGVSPRQLSHYREVSWREAPAQSAVLWQEEIGRILVNSYPHLPVAELTRRLREAGYPLGPGLIREHEAIASTQAAIWRLTNGLELDTTALDEPVRAAARIGDHPSARLLERDAEGRLNWHTQLPAGELVFLELELPSHLQLEAFDFTIGPRTGRHDVTVSLERSLDGAAWSPVSRSAVSVASGRAGRHVRRQLGFGATLSSASAASGQRGHRYYRLVASGPTDRDGLLDLTDIRLHLAGSRRFRNDDRVVFLYDLLLSQATGAAPLLRRTGPGTPAGELLGPFTLAESAATITAAQARVVDADGNGLWGPISPGTRFFLHRDPEPSGELEVRLHPHHVHARVLIGSRTPGGPGVFTPLVSIAGRIAAESNQNTIVLTPSSSAPWPTH